MAGEPKYQGLESERALGLERAEEILKGIAIPPRPAVLIKVLEEQRKAESDLHLIADLISSDVALAASTLKVVNSPFFGLRRKITSVHHAVRLLGVKNIANIVTGLMLHTAFSGPRSRFLEEFWAAANRLAMLATLVAQGTESVSPDEAYTLGLFADCGAALLVRRFPSYPEVYKTARLVEGETASVYEERILGTDHTVVGYMIGRSWQLPDTFLQAILRHHDPTDYYAEPFAALGEATGLLAVLMVAQYLDARMQGLPPAYEWTQVGQAALDFIRLSADGLRRLEEEAPEVLRAVPYTD